MSDSQLVFWFLLFPLLIVFPTILIVIIAYKSEEEKIYRQWDREDRKFEREQYHRYLKWKEKETN